MRWSNKGREFERLASEYRDINKIVVYGFGEVGKELNTILTGLGVDKQYELKYYDQRYSELSTQEFPVMEPSKMLQEKDKTTSLVVIAISNSGVQIRLKKILISNGYSHQMICSAEEFLQIIFPVFASYYLSKLFFRSVQISIGDQCNLQCQDCTNFVPYLKTRKNRELSEICADLDFLFGRVDYIRYMPILGGETFLHPDLEAIIKYILSKYKNQISKLQIYTNGTLPNKLSESFLSLLQKNDNKVWLYISNYTYNNPHLTDKFDAFISILQKHNIPFFCEKNVIWNDVGIKNNCLVQHENVEDFVSTCSVPCRDYENGKLYYCSLAKYASKMYEITDINNHLDLNHEGNPKVITEFMEGFIEDGRLEICKICNGYDQMTNPYLVSAGLQVSNKG